MCDDPWQSPCFGVRDLMFWAVAWRSLWSVGVSGWLLLKSCSHGAWKVGESLEHLYAHGAGFVKVSGHCDHSAQCVCRRTTDSIHHLFMLTHAN